MAIVSIKNSQGTYVDLPAPSSLDVSYNDISRADRNANGLMIIERITTKRKLALHWEYLDAASLKTLLALVQQTFFDTKYFDALTNATYTGSFYAGDRSVSFIDYNNGVARYTGISVDLIER